MIENLPTQVSSKEGPTLMISNRPFFRQQMDIDQAYLAAYGYEALKYPLGFTDTDLRTWRENNYSLLEIGPGEGVSFEQLLKTGFDVYAIEPALRYENEDAAEKAKQKLFPYVEQGRVSSVNAVDAAEAFSQKFDLAFAIGPNFHSYSKSENAFYAQLVGILHALKKEPHTYLTFGIKRTGEIKIDEEYIPRRKFREVLELLKIKFEIIVADGQSYAIKIFRLNDKNQDAAALLTNYLLNNP